MESKIKTSEMTGLYTSEEPRTAIVDVEFGSPMKNCLNYGICRVTIPAAAAQGRCPCLCRATVRAYEDSMLQFVFDKKNMPAKTFEKHFSNGFFQVDDGYTMPPGILQKIGLEKYAIKEGRYPILMEGGKMKIIF